MKIKVSVSLPESWVAELDRRWLENKTSRSAELQAIIRKELEGKQCPPLPRQAAPPVRRSRSPASTKPLAHK